MLYPNVCSKAVPTQVHTFLSLYWNWFKEKVQCWFPSLPLKDCVLSLSQSLNYTVFSSALGGCLVQTLLKLQDCESRALNQVWVLWEDASHRATKLANIWVNPEYVKRGKRRKQRRSALIPAGRTASFPCPCLRLTVPLTVPTIWMLCLGFMCEVLGHLSQKS